MFSDYIYSISVSHGYDLLGSSGRRGKGILDKFGSSVGTEWNDCCVTHGGVEGGGGVDSTLRIAH